jgi:transglutaminase-like putative cysteine protease
MNHRLTLAAAAGTALASTALYPLYDSWQWFWAGLGAIVVVAAVGTLTRRRRLPFAVCLAAGLAGLLLYLNVLFAAGHSWLLVVPNRSSLGYLWQLATQGMTDADRFSPPVPPTPGLVLLGTAGIALAALATDTLAVRLRSSALAGLPLLALFIVPTTTPAARGGLGTTIVFCLGTAGYLLILNADGRERIRLWGRPIGLWRGPAPSRSRSARAPGAMRETDARSLAAAGRRIGAASVAVALCVPLFIPGLRVNHMFPAHVNVFGSAGAALGPGNGATVPNPLAQMTQDLREGQSSPVLTYRTTDPEPQYLQMYILGNLSTTAWTMGPGLGSMATTAGPLPSPQGLTGADRNSVVTHITVGRGTVSSTSGVSFLPVPYPATKISAPGHWVMDASTSMVLGFGATLSGLAYTVTSDDISPTTDQLNKAPAPPAAIADEYLNVPAAFRPLAALARRVTSRAKTDYGKAIALQQWFTQSGGFTYSLNATEPPNATGLSHFLTVTRRGYCQQFAFAMAVLARLLGIPSRVAVGFTSGSPTAINTWTVKTSDAHAWPELYFEGAGWLRFEPTPAGSGGQGTAIPPTYTVPQTAGGSSSQAFTPLPSQPNTGSSGTGGNNSALNPRERGLTGHGSATGALPGTAAFPAEPVGLAVLALLAVAAAAPRTARTLRRRRRYHRAGDAERAHAAWREVLDDLSDYRIPWRPSESPRATARRVADESGLPPPAAEALRRVALAEERARYAGAPSPAPPGHADLDQIRRGLAASAGRRARWRARLYPASALAPARTGMLQLTEAAARAQSSVWRLRRPPGMAADPASGSTSAG